jgi:hypothetical protein
MKLLIYGHLDHQLLSGVDRGFTSYEETFIMRMAHPNRLNVEMESHCRRTIHLGPLDTEKDSIWLSAAVDFPMLDISSICFVGSQLGGKTFQRFLIVQQPSAMPSANSPTSL